MTNEEREAVFEQAHAPTAGLSSKSDWEALTLIARDVHNYDGRAEWLSLSGADAGRIAAAAIAAGFRRTVQGEPTVQQVEDACTAFYEHATGLTSWARLVDYDKVLANRYRDGMRRALRAAAATRGEGKP